MAVGLSFARYAEGTDPPTFLPPVEEHRLANGLRVVLAPDQAMSDISVIVRYEAGKGDDPNGLEGLAHVTEHVMFSAFRSGAHAKLLLQAGASNLNAHTHLDFTSFEETVPPEALDLALWLEGARMATAGSAIDEKAVIRERTVAGHEYRQRGQLGFQALGPFFELEWDELYPDWHPYHLPVDALGALDRIRPDDVRAFARTWYGPDNASIALAGHFEAGHALSLIQKYFGPHSARTPPHRPLLPRLPPPGNLWLDVEALVVHPVALMAWRGPKVYTIEDRALTVAALLLGRPRGALRREFVDNDGDALRILVRQVSASAGSAFVVAVEPKAGISLADLLPAVQSAMAAFPTKLKDSDLDQVKQELSRQQRDSLETSMGRAWRLADPHGLPSWGMGDYEGIDRACVIGIMSRFLAPAERVTMVVRAATQPLYGATGVLLHRDRMAQ
jgi:predicted Zn-dependent peptidase